MIKANLLDINLASDSCESPNSRVPNCSLFSTAIHLEKQRGCKFAK